MPLPFFISFTTKSSSWLTAPVMFQCKTFTTGSAYFTMCCCRHLLPKVSSSEAQLLILLKAIHQFIRRVCQIQVTTVCWVTTKTNCCRFFSSTRSRRVCLICLCGNSFLHFGKRDLALNASVTVLFWLRHQGCLEFSYHSVMHHSLCCHVMNFPKLKSQACYTAQHISKFWFWGPVGVSQQLQWPKVKL